MIGVRKEALMDLESLRSSKKAACTLTEVAELFDCDPRTISKGIAEGNIPSIKMGRRILVPREMLLALLTAPAAK